MFHNCRFKGVLYLDKNVHCRSDDTNESQGFADNATLAWSFHLPFSEETQTRFPLQKVVLRNTQLIIIIACKSCDQLLIIVIVLLQIQNYMDGLKLRNSVQNNPLISHI